MKDLDSALIAIVFGVWAVLALLYATVEMIHMPPAVRVWGGGALLFLALAVVVWLARRRGGRAGRGSA